MLKWFLRRQIAAFERTWNYDASYIREMIDADPRAMMVFGKVQGLSQYRKDVPLAAYCAAGLVAVMAEDCGPCTQLGIDMAQREGSMPPFCAQLWRATTRRCLSRSRWRSASLRRPCAMRRKPTICAKRFCAAGASAA